MSLPIDVAGVVVADTWGARDAPRPGPARSPRGPGALRGPAAGFPSRRGRSSSSCTSSRTGRARLRESRAPRRPRGSGTRWRTPCRARPCARRCGPARQGGVGHACPTPRSSVSARRSIAGIRCCSAWPTRCWPYRLRRRRCSTPLSSSWVLPSTPFDDALRDGVEPFVVEVALGDVVVARDVVAVVQLVEVDRIVVAHDPVVRIRVARRTRACRTPAGRSAACRPARAPCRRPAHTASAGSSCFAPGFWPLEHRIEIDSAIQCVRKGSVRGHRRVSLSDDDT